MSFCGVSVVVVVFDWVSDFGGLILEILFCSIYGRGIVLEIVRETCLNSA